MGQKGVQQEEQLLPLLPGQGPIQGQETDLVVGGGGGLQAQKLVG